MKKFLSIALSLVILCSVFITPIEVNAAQVCGNCERGVLLESKAYGSYIRTGSRHNCTHGYGFGQDLEESRNITVTVKCNVCGVGYTYSTSDTRWVCYGFN